MHVVPQWWPFNTCLTMQYIDYFLFFRKVRNKIPGQILLNFCIALSLTLIVFLAAAERSRTSSLAACRSAAIFLHYFLLAAFFWMAVEAFNMYMSFVKIFSKPHHFKFMLKCCIFAWGKICYSSPVTPVLPFCYPLVTLLLLCNSSVIPFVFFFCYSATLLLFFSYYDVVFDWIITRSF